MRKNLLSITGILAVLMALSLAFTIPSGAITESAQNRYFEALWDEEEEDFFDEEARLPKP